MGDSGESVRTAACVIEVGHPAGTPAEWRSSTQPELTVCTRHKGHYETAYDDYSHLAPWLPIEVTGERTWGGHAEWEARCNEIRQERSARRSQADGPDNG